MAYWRLEAVLNYFNKPTHYEEQHNIHVVGKPTLIEDCGETKFYFIKKSDNTKTLLVVFKTTQGWYGWLPSKSQYKTITTKFKEVYEDIETHNKEARKNNKKEDPFDFESIPNQPLNIPNTEPEELF